MEDARGLTARAEQEMTGSGAHQAGDAPGPRSPGPWLGPLALIVVAFALLLPWLRNHTLIHDPYDWSMYVAGVGKWQSGLRPYVDYDTPLQSGSLLAGFVAEKIFGPSYLSLTYGNALLILGTFLGGWLLLRSRFGPTTAAVAAASVALAAPGQHAILWYNPLSIVALLLATWTLATWPSDRPFSLGRTTLVALALVASGITKLNFHLVTLAFAAGLVVFQGVAGARSLGATAYALALILVAGLPLPVWLELRLSGADFATWWRNVVELPQQRFEFLSRLREPGYFLAPAHPFYFRPTISAPATWVVGAAALLGVGLAVGLWRGPSPRPRVLALLALLATPALAAAGAALVVTNIDIVFVNLAATATLGWALYAASRPFLHPHIARRLGSTWVALTLVFAALAWVATWRGARVLYGNPDAKRADYHFVSADDLPAEFRYFRGTQIAPELHEAFRAVHGEISPQKPELIRHNHFSYGMDWLERVWPQATTRDLPLWMAVGVTYNKDDWASVLSSIVSQKQATLIFTVPHWDLWPREFLMSLQQSYRREDLAPWARAYRLTGASAADRSGVLSEPIPFLFLAQSNIMSRTTRSDAPLLGLFGPPGRFAGNARSTRWNLAFVSYRFRGEAVAMLGGSPPATEIPVEFRVIAHAADHEQVLWQDRIVLSSQAPHASRSFAIDPGGRHLRLETIVPSGTSALAGWKNLIITHSGPVEADPPLPLHRELPVLPDSANLKLFADVTADYPIRAYAREVSSDGESVTLIGAGELWSLPPPPTTRLTGRIEVPVHPGGADRVHVQAYWYKSGRLELFLEETLEPGTARDHFEFDQHLPEPEGWIGVVVRDAGDQDRPVALRLLPFRRP